MASSSADYQRIVSEGLRALQQQEYDRAIALLKPVMGDRQGPGGARLKAALGVFQAYGESGQTAAAQKLGQQLKSHPNAQVRDQATYQWNRLFPAPTAASPMASSDGADSGFMPFGDGPEVSTSPNPNFQPLSADPPPQKVVRPKIQSSASPVSPIAPPAAPETAPKAASTSSSPPAPLSNTSPPGRQTIAQRVVINPNTDAAGPGSPSSSTPFEDPQTAAPGAASAEPQPYVPHWRNGDKIAHWGTLPGAPGFEYQVLQWLSVIAFAAIATAPFVGLAWLYNQFIYQVDWLPGVNNLELIALEPGSFVGIWILWAAILVVTPWLIDEGLKRFCQARPLRLLDLNSQCPETGKLLQRQCRRYKITLPQLRLLPTMDLILFSYGFRQANARIVVSQGVLAAVEDGELATLFGAELGHILVGDMRIMGWGSLILSLPFGVYWGTARLMDRWQMPIPRALMIALSAMGYECFRLGRWPLLWLSRARVGYGDRQGILMTGDPNGLSRALVKLAIATTARLHDQKFLSPMLELTQLLLPVPPPQAIALGSLYPHSPIEPYLQWERRNPYRHWLRSNSTHPTLGDRLFRLSQWAERWKLEPEWDLSRDQADAQTLRYLPRVGTACLPPTPFTLWSQSAPTVGALIGIGVGVLLWMPGGIGEMLDWRWLNWMYSDHASLMVGLTLIGFGCGTIIRINSFFPDIKTLGLTTSGTPECPLAAELNDPNALPINSRIVRLQGQLLGRAPSHNLVAQDWWIQTSTGTLKLHLGDRVGHVGKLWRHWTRPIKPNQPVEAIGWLRRGATPWMDVDILNHKNSPSHTLIKKSWTPIDSHPLWSTGLAVVTILLGLWILNRGL